MNHVVISEASDLVSSVMNLIVHLIIHTEKTENGVEKIVCKTTRNLVHFTQRISKKGVKRQTKATTCCATQQQPRPGSAATITIADIAPTHAAQLNRSEMN